MQVPPPFAASPALLATTYKQSLITLFNLFTLPPPGGFALTFPRIMAFSLTTPATYLTATMPELGLPSMRSYDTVVCLLRVYWERIVHVYWERICLVAHVLLPVCVAP